MGRRNQTADVFDVSAFAAAVEKHRQQPRRHHSLTEMHLLTGVPIATLSDVLRSERPPTLATAIRLAVYADLSLDKFITVTPDNL